MRKRWLGMESLVNIQWRWAALEMPRAKKQFFEGSPSVSSFHLPSVKPADQPHLLDFHYSWLTCQSSSDYVIHWSRWLAPEFFSQGPRAPDAAGSTGDASVLLGSGGSTYVRMRACVRICLLQTQETGRCERGQRLLGMAGKVIRLPEFRSVGMPNASKS